MAIGDLNIRLGLIVKGLQDGIKTAERDLKRFSANASKVGNSLTLGLSVPIIGAGAAAVKAFADFEKMRLGLEAVAGSSDEAEKQLSRLRKIALQPGLDLQQAVKGSIQLQTVGFSAEQAENALSQFAKAVTVSGAGAEGLAAVVKQITQINSKGKILQEDIGVILENVPSVGIALKEAFGTTSVEAIRGSGVSAREFTDKLIGAIEQSRIFQNAQGGLANQIENFGIAIKDSGVALGEAIAKSINLSGVLEKLSTFVSSLVDQFKALEPGVQKAIVQIALLVAAVGPAIKGFSLLASGVVALANPLTLIAVGLAALASAFIYAYDTSEDFRKGIGALVDGIGDFLTAIVDAFSAFGKGTDDYAKDADTVIEKTDKVGSALTALGRFFSGLGAAWTELSKIFSDRLRPIIAAFDAISEGRIKDALKNLGQAIAVNNPLGQAYDQGKRLAEAFARGQDDFDTKRATSNFGTRGRLGGLKEQTTPTGAAPITPVAPVIDKKAASEKIAKDIQETFSTEAPPITIPVIPTLTGGNQELGQFNRALINIKGALDDLPDSAKRFDESISGFAQRAFELEGFNVKMEETGNTMTRAQARAANAAVVIADAAQQLGETLSGAITQGLEDFGVAIGEFAAGVTSIGSIGTTILNALLNLVSQIGKLFIETGIGLIAIQVALESLNPYVAIAAGVALIALAAAVKSSLKKKSESITAFADGGIVTGPTVGLVGEAGKEAIIPLNRLPEFMGQNQPYELRTKISGDDLWIIMQRTGSRKNRIG